MSRAWPPAACLLARIALLPGLMAAPAGVAAPELIVVTASRLNEPADELSQTIGIITREQIGRQGAASAAEVLRQLPGANVIQQGGRGGISSILLRGGEPNFTVTLIDGIPVNDPTNTRGGAYDIGSLEQAQVERIETIYGAMSPVYGSDALSGVINVITRGAGSGSDFSVAAGTQGHGSASGFYGATVAGIDAGLGAWVTDDDGDVTGSSYTAHGLNGKFAATFAGTGTASLSAGYQDTGSTSFPEDSGGPRRAVIREVDVRDARELRAGLDLGYGAAGAWESGVAASVYRREEAYASPGIAPGVLDGVPPNAADTDFDRTQLRATLRRRFPGNSAGLVGVQWQNEQGQSAGILDVGFPLPVDFGLTRDTVSAFAEASVEAGPFVLQGGLRWDDPDAIRSAVTGRLGLVYRLADALTEWRANWGEGFKAPSFFALAHPLVGNPELRSETGDSFDLGVRRRFRGGNGAVEWVVFWNRYRDLVDFDPDLFRNVNRDSVVTRGAQAALLYAPTGELSIRANLTFLDTEVEDSAAILRGRPEWRGHVMLDWAVRPDWRWVTSALVLDEFYESSIATGGQWLDGYARVDTALNWQATGALSVRFAIDNLLDNDYEEAVGFPAAGLRGRVSARYRF